MVAGHTVDTRTHVMGDMLMVTGTFTDGGTSVSYDGLLTTVFAAGGHVTSKYDTGVTVNEGDDIVIGEVEITVNTVDARLHFNRGEAVYNSLGEFMGDISSLTATAITLTAGSLAATQNGRTLFKVGPDQGAVTLVDGTLAVSVDEIHSKVIFGNGNLGATGDRTDQGGRWWILGLR